MPNLYLRIKYCKYFKIQQEVQNKKNIIQQLIFYFKLQLKIKTQVHITDEDFTFSCYNFFEQQYKDNY